MSVLKKTVLGVNATAVISEDQAMFVIQSIGGIKTDLHGNPSKSLAEVALQLATFINSCR